MAGPDFPLRGGPPAVDLVNTTIVERGRPRDLLATEDGLAAWLELEQERLGLDSTRGKGRLDDFHALRAALRKTFDAVASAERAPAPAVTTINQASARDPAYPELEWPKEEAARIRRRSVGRTPSPDALAAVARSAIELLGGPDRARLRHCANPACILFFVADNPRRIFCSNICANRVRVARHKRRPAGGLARSLP